MKLYIYILVLIGLLYQSALGNCCLSSCDCQETSHSYLAIRPHFQSASPELVSAVTIPQSLYNKHPNNHLVQWTVFASSSTNTEDLARYFFPFCKTTLIADENAGEPLPRDLFTQHFNIFTRRGTFRSQISIAPIQKVAGFGLYYRYNFWSPGDAQGFWTSISFPLQRVINNLRLHETVLDNGGGALLTSNNFVFENMIQALQQPDWNFGKLSCTSCSKTGIADIEVKFGYHWNNEHAFIEGYGGPLIPTGNKPNAEFLFQPIVGHGKHGGIFLGSTGGYVWQLQCDFQLGAYYAAHSLYLFQNTQCRSFDLKFKPWSRYLQVYSNKEQALAASKLFATNAVVAANIATPGINIFTQQLLVKPGFIQNISAALVFIRKNWQFEFGYNAYWRSAECVQLDCPWQEGPALKHLDGRGFTNPFREITGNPILDDILTNIDLDNYQNNKIQESDLDLLSAAQPGFASHTFFNSIRYEHTVRSKHSINDNSVVFLSTGFSYEFVPHTNAAPERWTWWGKIGGDF